VIPDPRTTAGEHDPGYTFRDAPPPEHSPADPERKKVRRLIRDAADDAEEERDFSAAERDVRRVGNVYLGIGLVALIVSGIGVGLTFSKMLESTTAKSAPRKIGFVYVCATVGLILSAAQLKYPIRRGGHLFLPPRLSAILLPVGAVTLTPLCLAPITIVAAVWGLRILLRPDVQTYLEKRPNYQDHRFWWQ
jgi:F0F1-type ATP synthase membrane subunit c/vacuolar-type H+-ATPase subunit K